MPADDDDDEVLARQLGNLGKAAGKPGGPAGGLGGSYGARLAAGRLPSECASQTLEINARPDKLLTFASTLLNAPASGDESRKDFWPVLSGTVGAGFLNLNPAVVHLEIIAATATTCTVEITGVAKEGWIKQRTAHKAVQRIGTALSQHFRRDQPAQP